MPRPAQTARIALSTLAAVTAACTADLPTNVRDTDSPAINASVVSAAVSQQLAEIRALTAPFHRLEAAADAGYAFDAGCVDERLLVDPAEARGMGHHLVRTDKDLVGDGVVDLLEPEFIVYAPHPETGELQLGGVEYFVPTATWPHAEPPSVLGRPMHLNTIFDAWILHVWLWKENPDGMFEDFNAKAGLCECEISPTAPLCI